MSCDYLHAAWIGFLLSISFRQIGRGSGATRGSPVMETSRRGTSPNGERAFPQSVQLADANRLRKEPDDPLDTEPHSASNGSSDADTLAPRGDDGKRDCAYD